MKAVARLYLWKSLHLHSLARPYRSKLEKRGSDLQFGKKKQEHRMPSQSMLFVNQPFSIWRWNCVCCVCCKTQNHLLKHKGIHSMLVVIDTHHTLGHNYNACIKENQTRIVFYNSHLLASPVTYIWNRLLSPIFNGWLVQLSCFCVTISSHSVLSN